MHVRRRQPQSQWTLADFRARLLFTYFGLGVRQRERNTFARVPFCHMMPHFQVIRPYTNQFAPNRARRSIVIARLSANLSPRMWVKEITLQTSKKVRHNGRVYASS
jgi:hypothetical protein